jgi:hypothetical protein
MKFLLTDRGKELITKALKLVRSVGEGFLRARWQERAERTIVFVAQVLFNLLTPTQEQFGLPDTKLNLAHRKEHLVMARLRRTSGSAGNSPATFGGAERFTPKPDFGPGLTLEVFEAAVEALGAEQNAYNGEVSSLDEKTNLFDNHEQHLADLNQRILLAVKAVYGPDSSEYEQVGGIRRSDRKKRARQPAAKPA